MRRRAVFLDRDGVLNRAWSHGGVSHPPRSAADLELLPGVVQACDLLRRGGWLLIVVTNQPDIARGTQSREMVDSINALLRKRIPFDDLFLCPHDDGDACDCRKPLPGMLLAAADKYAIDLQRSFMVGDRASDIRAGRAAGCRTVFVDHGQGSRPDPAADVTVDSLLDAVRWIIEDEPILEWTDR